MGLYALAVFLGWGKDAGESIPAFEGQVAPLEGLAAVDAMASIDEAVGGLLLHCPADGEFQLAHLISRRANRIPSIKSETLGNRLIWDIPRNCSGGVWQS